MSGAATCRRGPATCATPPRASWADAREADIASGHTATDQVETILYRLASSPSRRALLGMRPRDGRLVRPLLSVTRASTAAHCRARGLEWREDESNATDAYARGRVRHGLVPALEAIHPAAQANVLALAQTLRDEAAVLDEVVDAVLGRRLGDRAEHGCARWPRLCGAWSCSGWPTRRPGVPPPAWVGAPTTSPALAHSGTAALDLPGGVRATARCGVLTFAPTPPLPAGRAAREYLRWRG